MKQIVTFLFSLLLFPSLMIADPIEDMTAEEAAQVMHYLYANPYIVDYCDCCDNYTPTLIRVYTAVTEPCSYNAERTSIKVQGQKICTFNAGGKVQKIFTNTEQFNEIISLNYTWGHAGKGKAQAIGKTLQLWDERTCKEPLTYPDAAKNSDLPVAYRDWYTQFVQATPPQNILDYYLLLDIPILSEHKFTQVEGKWKAQTYTTGEYTLYPKIDLANGFISIEDESEYVQIALFQNDNKKPVIAVRSAMSDGAHLTDNHSFWVWEGFWKEVSSEILPPLSPADFLASTNGIEPAELALKFVLPQMGTTIQTALITESWESRCLSGEEDFCDWAKRVKYSSIALKWNKAANGKFEIGDKINK